jgi:hypothetical protein
VGNGNRCAAHRLSVSGRWHGDDKARVAVYANRNERSFAHNLDRGGMRRTWLRGRENVHKRYLVHIAGHNLSILMRLLIGAGNLREAAARAPAYLFFIYTEDAVAIILVAASRDGFAILGMAVASSLSDRSRTSATGRYPWITKLGSLDSPVLLDINHCAGTKSVLTYVHSTGMESCLQLNKT